MHPKELWIQKTLQWKFLAQKTIWGKNLLCQNKPVKQGWCDSCVGRFECNKFNSYTGFRGYNGFRSFNGKVDLKTLMTLMAIMALINVNAQMAEILFNLCQNI